MQCIYVGGFGGFLTDVHDPTGITFYVCNPLFLASCLLHYSYPFPQRKLMCAILLSNGILRGTIAWQHVHQYLSAAGCP